MRLNRKWGPRFVVGILGTILALPSAAAAQEECGDCVGIIFVAHIFPDVGEPGPDPSHKCIIPDVPAPVGCHDDWCLRGCEAHDECLETDDRDMLAAAIMTGNPHQVLRVMEAMDQNFEFDRANHSINVFCGHSLIARLPLPQGIDAASFAVVAGLTD